MYILLRWTRSVSCKFYSLLVKLSATTFCEQYQSLTYILTSHVKMSVDRMVLNSRDPLLWRELVVSGHDDFYIFHGAAICRTRDEDLHHFCLSSLERAAQIRHFFCIFQLISYFIRIVLLWLALMWLYCQISVDSCDVFTHIVQRLWHWNYPIIILGLMM